MLKEEFKISTNLLNLSVKVKIATKNLKKNL